MENQTATICGMSYTQADLDNINAEIAGAESAVSSGDTSVTYRPLHELQKIRRLILADLNKATRTHPRHQVASFADV